MNQLARIRRAWRNGNLVPFIGAGVPKGAAALPGWADVVDRGIAYLRAQREALQLSERRVDELEARFSAEDLVGTFGTLQGALGGVDSDHYQAFLFEQFGYPQVTDAATLQALRGLRPRIAITTNYDMLLEQYEVVAGGEPTTWLQPDRILSMLRGDSGVIHLHGRYDVPDSVILSRADYERIVNRPEDSVTVARTVFHSGILLFIGASLQGVQDPHLGAMLEEFGRIHGAMPDRATPHYMLVRSGLAEHEKVRLRRLGVEPVVFGESYADLPRFIDDIVESRSVRVRVDNVRERMHSLGHGQSLTEVLSGARTFIEDVVYPERHDRAVRDERGVRVAFAEKVEVDGVSVLQVVDPQPRKATHNVFDYPQTLAAWALIEGRILRFPADLERPCDFEHLERIGKLDRVVSALLDTDTSSDPTLAKFLDAATIKRRAEAGTLLIRDIYQHWVGRQPSPHYKQFISVPVPIVERVSHHQEPDEFCVINIDTLDDRYPLLTTETEALLKLLSDIVAIGYRIHGGRAAAARPSQPA